PAALSLMTGAPIIPCFMIREGARFRLIIEPPVRPPQAADRARAAALLTQAWSDVIESYIRRYPDQWVWMHRRWKTQPNSVRSPKSEVRSSDSRLQAPSSGLQASGSRLQAAHGLQVVRSLLLLAACCLLLAGTQGCAKSGPPGGKPQATAASSPEPQADQAMSEFTLNGYNEEKSTRWTLNGQGANLDGNIVTIHRPDAVGYDPARTAYLTASLAQMNQQNRSIRMEHDVTIHTSDGLWFASPILYWIPDHDQVATDQPVRIETDHMLLRGRGMDGFTQLKQATILEDIELVLNPGTHEAPAEEPSQVTITCDGPLAFDYEHHVATFERNVHVKDASGDLYSDKLVAYLDQATHTIRYADAIGRVRIHQDQNTALSERAVYEPALGKVTLLGKPSLLVYPSSSGGSKGTQLSFGGLIAAPGEATKASAPIEPQKRADAPAPGKLAE
ncbi:MAG: LPS export ABC transporter periplasmic protein LptC, partial [Candidatus Omnitrophica bacterium]|nr:LPS export ABC transporter periplasmic protein LptC [Candidatus Omnitrophota bacterium]